MEIAAEVPPEVRQHRCLAWLGGLPPPPTSPTCSKNWWLAQQKFLSNSTVKFYQNSTICLSIHVSKFTGTILVSWTSMQTTTDPHFSEAQMFRPDTKPFGKMVGEIGEIYAE